MVRRIDVRPAVVEQSVVRVDEIHGLENLDVVERISFSKAELSQRPFTPKAGGEILSHGGAKVDDAFWSRESGSALFCRLTAAGENHNA